MSPSVRRLRGGFLENVKGLMSPPKFEDGIRGDTVTESNLAICLRELYMVGVLGCTVLLDPRLFGHPQSRPRLYIVLYSRTELEHAGLSDVDAYKITVETLESFAHHGLVPIDAFLLRDDDPLIVDMIEKATSTSLIGSASGELPDTEAM